MGERTLRALLPEIPHVRVRGVVLIPVDMLKEWLRGRAVAPEAEAKQVADEALNALRSQN